MVRTFFGHKLIMLIVVMVVYIMGLVIGFHYLTLWRPSSLTATVLWAVAAVFVTLLNLNSISEDEHYFRKAALEQVQLLVLLEFVVTFYVFDLRVELIIIPVTVLIGGMLALAESDSKYGSLKKLLELLLGVFGIALILFSLYKAVTDLDNFASSGTLREFVLFPLMSLAFLPLIYVVALWVRYESLFLQLSFLIRDKDLVSFAKRQTVKKVNLRLNLLNAWAREATRLRPESKVDILNGLTRAKARSGSRRD